tara:strand:- start:854 stop:1036 length:183 start_codon:yes stop_codon:yes gene_type:complete
MQRIFAANDEADSKTNGHCLVVRRVYALRMPTTATHSKMRLSAMVEHGSARFIHYNPSLI